MSWSFKCRLCPALFGAAALLITPIPLLAEPELDIDQLFKLPLNELIQVHSSSKQLEPSIYAPGTVYVISVEEIERYGFRSLQDALQLVPSVYLYDPHSWVWGGQRGIVSNFSQTLLLVNGREVNNLIALEGFISRQFSSHNIERIEVIAGPSSTLYGANALAGVINVISKEYDKNYSGFNVGLELGSFDSRTVDFTFTTQLSKSVRFSGSARYFQSDEEDFIGFVNDREQFLAGWEDAELAAPLIDNYNNPSRASNLEFQFDFHDFYLGFYGYENKQSHGLEKLSWRYNDNEDYRRFELYYGGVNHAISDKVKVKAEYQYIRSRLWGVYYQGLWPVSRLQAVDGLEIFNFPESVTSSEKLGSVELTGLAQYQEFYPSFAHYLIDQQLLNADAISDEDINRYFDHIYSNKNSDGSVRQRLDVQIDWQIDQKSTLITGLSYDNIDYVGLAVTDAAVGVGASFAVPLDPAKREDVYDSEKYSFYTQYKRQFTSMPLWITAGVRYDEQQHYGSTVNPRASLVWEPVSGSVVELAYSEAFREPNVFELASDSNIKPATMDAWEVSYSQLLSKNVTLQLAIYENNISDFLGSVSSLIGSGVGSIDSQKITGMEFQLDGSSEQWRYFINGARIFSARQKLLADDTVETTDILGISKTKMNVGITKRIQQWDASLFFRYQQSYPALSGNRNITEVFNIDSTRELNFSLLSPTVNHAGVDWRCSLNINNLTDRDNFDANIRRSGPHMFLQDGRAFNIRLTATF